jgi:hypothetical protein
MTSIREKKVGKEKEKRKHEDGDLRHAQGAPPPCGYDKTKQ